MKPPFTKRLLKWNELVNTRQMPWKGEKDPYRIWLSEIILQQTRVEQGLAYYNKFIETFPTVHDLANAPEQEIFKLWEGLGYYSRCKNIIATAKFISKELNGRFPDTYDDVKALKGIGPYTAAAITSFAYNLPYAVVDGNVLRVLSRFFGIDTPIDSTQGKKQYNQLAEELLDKQFPALYNQAIMDFGAVVCKAQLPLCNVCVQQIDCRAYNENMVKLLPVKSKKLVKRIRWFYYFIIEYKGALYIRKRGSKDIWENLYEFVLHETDTEIPGNPVSLQLMFDSIAFTNKFKINTISEVYRQQLTHQTIMGQFIRVNVNEAKFLDEKYIPVKKEDLLKYPFPKIISNWLMQNQPV